MVWNALLNLTYLSILILILLWVIGKCVSGMNVNASNLVYPFESGFENQNWIVSQPSLHFFSVGLIFVLFDLELLYLFGLFYCFEYSMITFLILILFLTLWLEYMLSTLSWHI